DRGPALNAGALPRARQDGDLFHTIRDGVAGSQMPPFRNLTDTEVWQLVSYVRSLAAPGAPGARGRDREAPAPLVVASLRDGREVRRIRKNEATFPVQTADAPGPGRLLDKRTVASVRIENDRPPALELPPLTATDGLTFERLRKAEAEPHNWPMYWGNYRGTHY